MKTQLIPDPGSAECSRYLKKWFARLLPIAILFSNSMDLCGQGTVVFANYGGAKVVNAQNGRPITLADNMRAALYWAPAGLVVFTQLGASVRVGAAAPGLFFGGTRITGPATAGGQTARFQVRVWPGTYASYELAKSQPNVLIGQSIIINNPTGDPGAGPPYPPPSPLLVGGLGGIQVSPNTPSGPPVIVCSPDKTVPCGSLWTFDVPAAVDGCTGLSAPSALLNVLTNGSCPQVITATWAATNSCDGQFNTCTQTVTVADSTPILGFFGPHKTVECGAAWSFDPPSALDACMGVSLTPSVVNVITNGPCPDIIACTWAFTNLCGTGFLLCTQEVTVVNTRPPLLGSLPNQTVSCGSAWSFLPPAATDACTGAILLPVVIGLQTNGTCPQVITCSWAATNSCGTAFATCAQQVAVEDTSPPGLVCGTNKTVDCSTSWPFDAPTATDCFGQTLPVTPLETSTNVLSSFTQLVTRTWGVTNLCNGLTNMCNQTVEVTCTNSVALLLTLDCPPNPVPAGGLLSFRGLITNQTFVPFTNVVVVSDQPVSGTLVFGPAVLDPGTGATFSGSYRVAPCSSGPYIQTLLATAAGWDGILHSNSVTAFCAGTNGYAVPGDLNGDGFVDQDELNAVLTNYWAHSQWLFMTNSTRLPDGLFQFALTNVTRWNFTVRVSTNLVDWTNLPGPAYPVYQFTDPEAAADAPKRFYRLQWP